MMMIDKMEGIEILTLDVTVGVYLLAVGVNIDLRTGPGAVEVDVDNHVCVCGVKVSNWGVR